MKKFTITIFILALFATNFVFSQDTQDDLNRPQFMEYITQAGIFTFYIPDAEKQKSDFNGSPYLYDDFSPGYILVDDSILINNIELRYNVFAEQMQMKYQNKVSSIAVPDRVNKVVLNNEIFNYLKFFLKDKIQKGYFCKLTKGKLTLLKKYKCELIGSSYNKALDAGNKNSTFSIKKYYYILDSKKNISEVKLRKKKILKLFSDKKDIVKKYADDNNLSFRKEKDLIKIINYYNSL